MICMWRRCIWAVVACSLAGAARDLPEAPTVDAVDAALHLLIGHAELLQIYACEGCCVGLPLEVEPPKAWRAWRNASEHKMARVLKVGALKAQSPWEPGQRALALGVCLLRHCGASAAGLRRCNLDRQRSLALRLRLSWALLTRGERADLSTSLLQDALALSQTATERRACYEHLAMASLRVGDLEKAAVNLKTALDVLGDEVSEATQAASRKAQAQTVSRNWRDYVVSLWRETTGYSSTDSGGEEDVTDRESSRVLRSVQALLEWRLASVLLVAGREAEAFHYFRGVVRELDSSVGYVLQLARDKAPISPPAGVKSSKSATTAARAAARVESKAQSKAQAAAEAAESEASSPVDPQWIIWHALRVADFPPYLPVPGDQLTAALSAEPLLDVELRGLSRYLAAHRYLDAESRHQLGRSLHKRGLADTAPRHLAMGALPWERGSASISSGSSGGASGIFGSSSGGGSGLGGGSGSINSGGAFSRALGRALVLPLVPSSARALAVAMGALEDDLAALLLGLARDKVDATPASTHHVRSENGGKVISSPAGSARSSSRVTPQYSSGNTGRSSVSSTGDSTSSAPVLCGGQPLSEALAAGGGLTSALELWPLEHWAAHADDLESLDATTHGLVDSGSGQRRHSPALRPPLPALLAALLRRACPPLVQPPPPPPRPPPGPPQLPPPAPLVTNNIHPAVAREVSGRNSGRNRRNRNVGKSDTSRSGSGGTSVGSSGGGGRSANTVSTAPPPPPLVVGVVASRLRNGPAARLTAGWLRSLSTAKGFRHAGSTTAPPSDTSSSSSSRPVRTLAMCFPTAVDSWTRLLLPHFDGSVNLVASLPESVRRIAAVRPDVLLFVDLPLDWRCLALAHHRLANTQVAFWGSTTSTHLPSMDYFVLPPGAAPPLLVDDAISASDDGSKDNSGHPSSSSSSATFTTIDKVGTDVAESATTTATHMPKMPPPHTNELLTNGWPVGADLGASLLEGGSGAGGYLMSNRRWSEQPVLLRGGGSFRDPLAAAGLLNNRSAGFTGSSSSSGSARARGRRSNRSGGSTVDRYSWVVPWVELQQRFLLPDEDAEAAAFQEDDDDGDSENEDEESSYSGSQSHAWEETEGSQSEDVGASSHSKEASQPRRKGSGHTVPAYLVLPLRTHQWHPDLDAPVASLLEAGATLVVVAEWTLVDTGSGSSTDGDDSTLTRHDIHQAAAPAAWERQLRARVGRKLPTKKRRALLARLHWLPPLAAPDYLSVLYHARGALDPFPVANPVGSLDAFAVGTPVLSAPPLQRLGFQLGGALWHGLLAHCPAESLGRALSDAEVKWPMGGDVTEDGDGQEDAALSKACIAEAAAAASAAEPVSYDVDGTAPPVSLDVSHVSSSSNDVHPGGACGHSHVSGRGPALLERYDGLLPPVAGSVAELVRAGLEVGDPHDPRLANHLRAAVNACRGSLFGDDQSYAADLRRFLVAAARSAAASGELYTVGPGGSVPNVPPA